MPLTHIFNPLSRAIEEMEQQSNVETEQSERVQVTSRGR